MKHLCINLMAIICCRFVGNSVEFRISPSVDGVVLHFDHMTAAPSVWVLQCLCQDCYQVEVCCLLSMCSSRIIPFKMKAFVIEWLDLSDHFPPETPDRFHQMMLRCALWNSSHTYTLLPSREIYLLLFQLVSQFICQPGQQTQLCSQHRCSSNASIGRAIF